MTDKTVPPAYDLFRDRGDKSQKSVAHQRAVSFCRVQKIPLHLIANILAYIIVLLHLTIQ